MYLDDFTLRPDFQEDGAMPQVSIGLPVYNGERHVKDAIQSILGQTLTDFELIISDNASTDDTERICREFAEQDQRIRYDRNPRNLGAAANYNRVFALSTGKYFKWAAHDDMCAPEYLAKCVDVLERHPAVVLCYPRAKIIDDTGIPIKDYDDCLHLDAEQPSRRLRGYFLNQLVFQPVFGVMRRAVLAQTPLIANYIGSDFVLLARLALAGQIYEIPERLFWRREHSGRASHLTTHKFAQWWNPDNRAWFYCHHWRWLVEYIDATRAAEISASEKLRCYVEIMRWTYWRWPRLLKELLLPMSVRFPTRGSAIRTHCPR
jgi:glycosyltransferase involved in cell wall biosynthesis